jgi:aryl-phospho-beta-D-glucosidase BglC (GH1 family)
MAGRIRKFIGLCIFLLVGAWCFPAHAAAAPTPCSQPFALSASGRYIVDACGDRFKLKSVNWYGGSDTWQVPLGLDKQPIERIVALIQQMGFNSVRLQFSNQMVHATAAVDPGSVAANPALIGSTPLQVYDAVVQGLTSAGIVVVLNNHTTYSAWCCNYDGNGLWFGGNGSYSQSTQQWQADWLSMVQRYSHNPLVAAADLRNEVRPAPDAVYLPNSPVWGGGGSNDWRLAALQAGNQILAVRPGMLVIVEGINWTGATGTLGGYRPLLGPVAADPIGLIQPDKLVYAEHSYGYIGPAATGNASVDGGNPSYESMDQATLYRNLDAGFGYVANNDFVYTAPVWVSEFGVGFNASAADQAWFANFTSYLAMHDLDFAYWALNGTNTTGEEGYGLLADDWGSVRNDWRTPYLNALLQAPSVSGPVSADMFREADYGPGDDNQSATLGDWNPGASKATCPDGYHVAGASLYNRWKSAGRYRILCTNQTWGSLWSPGNPISVQGPYESPRYHGYDWAGGYTKYECPLGTYVAGASKLWWGTAGVMCAQANRPMGNSCRTVWFNGGDNRSSTKGGDWAPGAYKGQAADDEYVAGIAQSSGNAAALLVCH